MVGWRFMTPGTVVLLHSPLTTVAAWGALPAALQSDGLNVIVPEITDDDRPPYMGRYVAGAAVRIADAAPEPPLVLVGHSAGGPLLPAVGAAQRAAHRQVGGYVFYDAQLPGPGETTWLEMLRNTVPGFEALLDEGGRFPNYPPPRGLEGALRPRGKDYFTEPLPMPQDWPDAPCGVLRTSAMYEEQARQASLRGWPVAEHERGHFAAFEDPEGTAAALHRLIGDL
jgi:hypothetical protein